MASAAAVALACDFLRARNAQLREAVKQMKARQTGPGRGPKPAGPRRTPVKPAPMAPGPVAMDPRKIEPGQAPLTAPEFTTRRGRSKPDPRVASSEPAGSSPALSTWLIERATARAARKTSDESAIGSAPAEPTLCLVPAPEPQQPIVIDAHLWADSRAAAPVKPRQDTPLERGFELIHGSGASHIDVRVPAGMHPSAGLSPLLENGQLFTGLVISIGAGLENAREMGQSVEKFVTGLLRAADFGCRASDDEFVLICAGLHGAEAQRHLSHVSERLWDYQLRTLGQSSIVFSLGGIDVQRESLSEAVASAKERMSQTRKFRNAVVPAQRRKAG